MNQICFSDIDPIWVSIVVEVVGEIIAPIVIAAYLLSCRKTKKGTRFIKDRIQYSWHRLMQGLRTLLKRIRF